MQTDGGAAVASDAAAAVPTDDVAVDAAANEDEAGARAEAATADDTGVGADGNREGHVDGNNAVPLKGADGWPAWPSVLQRYYATHTTSNHQRVHVHSNGICVLSVAPTHPALQPDSPAVTAINYRSHDAKNLNQTEVYGKRKTGAVFVTPRDMVCTLSLADGSEVTLYACVRANVIEINRRLVDNPALLGTPAGFLCVLQPKVDEKKSIGEACAEFDRNTPLSQDSSNAKRKAEGKPVRSDNSHGRAAKKAKRDANRPPCWTFQKTGKCKFGDKCRFLHGEAGQPQPTAEPASQPAADPPAKAEPEPAAAADAPAS